KNHLSPGLPATLSPSEGERDGVRGPMAGSRARARCAQSPGDSFHEPSRLRVADPRSGPRLCEGVHCSPGRVSFLTSDQISLTVRLNEICVPKPTAGAIGQSIVNAPSAPAAAKTVADRAGFIRDQLPQGGLFADMDWRISPVPFTLGDDLARALETLGGVLLQVTRAVTLLHPRRV